MKTINLIDSRYKISLIDKESFPKRKKNLVFQHGITEDYIYINLCGIKFITQDVYALERTNEVRTNEYSEDEIKVLSSFLRASLIIKNLKLIEILVRGIRDVELLSYFYDDVLIDREKWVDRICKIEDGSYDPVEVNLPARFDRHKYSVYQLLTELKKYKAKLCISDDFLNYRILTPNYRPREIDLSSLSFGEICDVVGNRTRANLSLLVKHEDTFFTYSIIRDGKLHVNNLVVISDNPYLRKKLYGARLVKFSIFKNTFVLDLSRIPVISRRFLNIKESQLVDSIINEDIQTKILSLLSEKTANPTKDTNTTTVGVQKPMRSSKPINNNYKYTELKIKLINKVNKNLITTDIATDYNTQVLELKKAAKKTKDLSFRYLLGKSFIPIGTKSLCFSNHFRRDRNNPYIASIKLT